jgi:hypothetical protein
MPREKVTFEYDEPVVVHLCYAQGQLVDNRYEELSEQYLFTAAEGLFYLSDTAGGLLNARLRSRASSPVKPLPSPSGACPIPTARAR